MHDPDDVGQPQRRADEIRHRRAWFAWYVEQLTEHSTVREARPGVRYPCPCCDCRTLSERGGYEVCPVCYWEDDGQDDADADVARGGPNGVLSLTEARANYRRLRACEERNVPHVRPPRPEERP